MEMFLGLSILSMGTETWVTDKNEAPFGPHGFHDSQNDTAGVLVEKCK